MPTYEYICKNCGKTIEVFQSFADKPLKKHAECGGQLQKVFHARGIVFRGSGFYATDGKGSSSTQGEEAGDKPKTDKPTEKKPAAKAAPATTSGD